MLQTLFARSPLFVAFHLSSTCVEQTRLTIVMWLAGRGLMSCLARLTGPLSPCSRLRRTLTATGNILPVPAITAESLLDIIVTCALQRPVICCVAAPC